MFDARAAGRPIRSARRRSRRIRSSGRQERGCLSSIVRRRAGHQVLHRRPVRAEESQGHPPQRLHARRSARARRSRCRSTPPGTSAASTPRSQGRPALLPGRQPGRPGVRVPAGALPGRRRLCRLVPGHDQLRLGELAQDATRTSRRSPGRCTFTHAEIKAGKTVQDVAFPRLGARRAATGPSTNTRCAGACATATR